jgi:hypothetical protein
MKVAAALFALLLVWAGVVGDARASSVTVGTYNGTPNCFPFSCFAAFSGNEFQEVYASSAFTAPITIDAVSFFEAGPGGLDSATYSVSFYTTTQPVDGLSTLGADHLGTLLSNFGAYSLSGAAPSVLTFNGNAFTYNPSSGNLLMVVTVTSFTQPGGNYAYFQSDSNGVCIVSILCLRGIADRRHRHIRSRHRVFHCGPGTFDLGDGHARLSWPGPRCAPEPNAGVPCCVTGGSGNWRPS